jgi:hypothetical protein
VLLKAVGGDAARLLTQFEATAPRPPTLWLEYPWVFHIVLAVLPRHGLCCVHTEHATTTAGSRR